MGEVSLGNLYDLNKTAVKNLRNMIPIEIANGISKMSSWVEKNGQGIKYYMLLCREMNDYTIFKMWATPTEASLKEFSEAMSDCFSCRGTLKAIDQIDNAFEIWIEDDEDVHQYLFFPYDTAVIEC